jgi:hypothetical protein
LAVDVDDGGGFVDRCEARGDDDRGDHCDQDERDDFPPVPAENPEVVRERNGLIFRLRLGVGIGRIKRVLLRHCGKGGVFGSGKGSFGDLIWHDRGSL